MFFKQFISKLYRLPRKLWMNFYILWNRVTFRIIGTRCILLKGVTIGARRIIGSGSVVTKSIPVDCIAVGNLCKVISLLNNLD